MTSIRSAWRNCRTVLGPFADLRAELATAHDLGPDALTPHAEDRAVQRDGVVHPVDPVDDAAVEEAEEPPGAADRGLERDLLARREAVE